MLAVIQEHLFETVDAWATLAVTATLWGLITAAMRPLFAGRTGPALVTGLVVLVAGLGLIVHPTPDLTAGPGQLVDIVHDAAES